MYWELKTGNCLWTTPVKGGHAERDYHVVEGLSPDGKVCALQWGATDGDWHLAVMDCRNGEILVRLPFFLFMGIRFSPDSRTLVLWKDDEIRCFDARTAKPLWRTTGQFYSLQLEPRFTPDGCLGFPRSGGFDFLDGRTGEVRRHLSAPTLEQVEAWNFSPDGKQLWWSNPNHQIFWRDLE